MRAVGRYILNPMRGQSMATATCAAHFNTPCAIEKVHQIVYELAARFEAANGTAAVDVLLDDVNEKRFNQPTNFWPTAGLFPQRETNCVPMESMVKLSYLSAQQLVGDIRHAVR